MKTFKNIILVIVTILILNNLIISQTVLCTGSDFVSRYIWRGLDFGNTVSIQPSLSLSSNDLNLLFWGSYPLTNTASGSEELDLSAGYTISNFSLIVTDYYFPNSGKKYGDYANGGAHTIEVGASYAGSEKFPLSISVFANVFNDRDNSIYFEFGYSTNVKDVDLDLFIGGTPGGDNAFYGTTNFNLINIGATVSKKIKITEDFSLPIFSTYLFNPNQEKGYLVFGISL